MISPSPTSTSRPIWGRRDRQARPLPRRSGTAGTGWPDTPIELPLPLPVDADLRVHGDGVKAGKIEIGAFATRLQADRQQAAVTIDQLQTFGGGLKGNAQG